MTKYLKAGGIKIQTSPFFDCSCGKTYRSLAWAKKHAAKHGDTIKERSPRVINVGKLYLLAPENLEFKILKPLQN
ncbi:MAG: hypothetical protein WC365_06175 [Candidatus Babeliales bacterium]|jgi:hypothetical protein